MDFPAEEGPGLSVFYKDENGEIFHTYSTYARGLDILLTMYNYLDMTPKGRDEEGMVPHAMAWVAITTVTQGGEAAGCCSGEAAKAPRDARSRCWQSSGRKPTTTRRVLQRVPADKLTWRPHREVNDTWAVGESHRDGAGRACGHGHRETGSTSRRRKFVPSQPKDLQEILSHV